MAVGRKIEIGSVMQLSGKRDAALPAPASPRQCRSDGPALLGREHKGLAGLSQSAEHIVGSMERQGVRRLIVETSLGVGDSRGQLGLIGTWIGVGVFLARIYADKERQERIIAGSQLDWTIVRPAMLTNGPQRQNYRTWSRAAPKARASRISRADVAHFMLSILGKTETYHRAVNCSY
jgi:putative NADH-flavin reductase